MTELVDFSKIIPGEAGLEEWALGRLFALKKENVPLLPVSFRKIGNKFLNLQGRHRLIYSKLIGEMPSYRIMESPKDYMEFSEYPEIGVYYVAHENTTTSRRWSYIEDYSVKGVSNFDEHFKKLKRKYSFLKNIEACEKYLNKKGLIEISFASPFM